MYYTYTAEGSHSNGVTRPKYVHFNRADAITYITATCFTGGSNNGTLYEIKNMYSITNNFGHKWLRLSTILTPGVAANTVVWSDDACTYGFESAMDNCESS